MHMEEKMEVTDIYVNITYKCRLKEENWRQKMIYEELPVYLIVVSVFFFKIELGIYIFT